MVGWATALLVAGELATPGARYVGHSVVAIEVERPADLVALEQMGIEVWTESPRPGIVHARVSPEAWPALAASSFAVEITTTDLQPIVDAEHFRVVNDPAADHDDTFFDDYRELDEIYAHLDALVALRPDIASTIDVGMSLEGRPIRGIEITAPDPDAPVILIDAGQHAREWISVSTGTCIADELVTRADEPEIASLLSQLTFVILPVVNPDGFAYTFTDDRFWRKNRRDGHGVDTNRNFGTAWGGPGSSGDPNAGNYRGEAEFSEPETAALRDLAEQYPNLRSSLDLHSFGQLVLFPWGYTKELAPAHDTLSSIADDMAAVMDDLGAEYTPLMSTMLYPAAGNAPDWFYGELGAYAFTYELRPAEAEDHDLGFVLPPEQIRDVCLEAMAGMKVLAEFTIAAAPGEPGDGGDADTGTSEAGSDTDEDDGAASTGATPSSTSDAPPTTSGMPASTSSPESATDTAETESSDAGANASASGGCGCGSNRAPTPLAASLLLLLVARCRRRCTHGATEHATR